MGLLRCAGLLACWYGYARAQIYVSPSGNDAAPGSEARPVRTLERARDLVRARERGMTGDLTVYVAAGTYRMERPLVLDARDSGNGGHRVIYSGASGGGPSIVSGGIPVTGWKLADRARNLWSAPVPAKLKNARQLYIDGVRATRTRGRLPVPVTPTASGYTAASAVMASWRNPAGLEFVYTGGNSIWSEREEGLGGWTEPRCPVASLSGSAIVMAQPCWDNSTRRILLGPGQRTANLVGPASVGKQPAYVENAFELLGTPGQFYLDPAARTIYYTPRPGEDLARADVEAPLAESLLSLEGTPEAPVHDVVFRGIRFSYAAWLGASGPEGFSEIQANYALTGARAWATQGLCRFAPAGDGQCPFGAWTKMPANVTLRHSRNIRFTGDAFLHLGAAGLDLGEGAQDDTVEGCAFSDISGNGLELGGVDQPLATGALVTQNDRIRNNHIWNIGAEFRGGIGIVVGYARGILVEHNQIDHIPYAAISMGWGGWPDKIKQPGQANYSENNVVAHNRIFSYMLVLADGGGIYTQGLTGPTLAAGEKVTGNVISGQFGSGHAIYTDNGSCNITVAHNVVFDTNFDNWGSRHADYYGGKDGKTRDPLAILDNYWQQGDADSDKDNVTVRGNHLIHSLDQAPAGILAAAGFEKEWRSLLNGDFLRPTAPESPSRVAAFAGDGYALVTWCPPVYEGGAAVESYRVTVSNGSQAAIAAADFLASGYVRIPGVPNGKELTFTATAVNGHGESAPSLPSRPVRSGDQPLPLPAAPARATALAGSGGMASIHFQDPAAVDKKAPGAPVIAYAVTIHPGGRKVVFTGRKVLALEGTTHTTFSVVDGLAPGTYTFSVAAVNPSGEGAAVETGPVKVFE